MAFSLSNMSPQQRQILMIGGPAVAVFALISFMGKKKSNLPTGNVGTQAPSTDTIGVGQLAEFENAVTGVLAQQGNTLDTIKTSNDVATQNQAAAIQSNADTLRATLSSALQSQSDTLQAQLSAVNNRLDQQSRATPAVVEPPAPPPSPPPPPAGLAPNTAVAVPNPIPNDASTVVVGKLADGNTYSYGGNSGQAALLTTNAEHTPVHTVSAKLKAIGR